MEKRSLSTVGCLLLLISFLVGGYAGGLRLGQSGSPEQTLPEAVSGEITAPAADAAAPETDEIIVLEEPWSFLEEGSGFALTGLGEAEQIWYHDMEQILGGYRTEVELSAAGLEAGLDESAIDKVFQCVLNDHPELFYVDGYSYTKYMKLGREDEIVSIQFSGRYNVDLEAAKTRQAQIQEAVEMILADVEEDASEYDKVKYVYDTLIRETDYQLSAPDNQNIYSVFVNHLSVCQGYAKAAQYLLNRLGVKCALVLGTVGDGEGHAWNLVNVDGSYYYVDVTWGDASYQLESGEEQEQPVMPEINYDYLNVTTAELLRTHTPGEGMLLPDCTDTAANYYVREGALFVSYDREQMSALFDRAFAEGKSDVTVKCADQTVYDQVSAALLDEKEIFDYLGGVGNRVAYTRNDDQFSLTFWVTNE